MQRLILLKLGVLLMAAVANADPAPAVTDTASPQTIPAPVAEELRRIQREMGGPVVDQFPSLKDQSARPARTSEARAQPLMATRHVVESLRTAATQLDDIANRLERLELYPQADSLREQAQRLRVDARRLTGGGADAPPWSHSVRPSGSAPLAPDARPLEAQPREAQPLDPVPSPE